MPWLSRLTRSKTWRTMLIVPLSLLLMWASALSASPYLHHLAHHDANSPAHECMATVMAKGEFLLTDAHTDHLVVPPSEVLPPVAVPRLSPIEMEMRLHGSRAPPVSIPLPPTS